MKIADRVAAFSEFVRHDYLTGRTVIVVGIYCTFTMFWRLSQVIHIGPPVKHYYQLYFTNKETKTRKIKLLQVAQLGCGKDGIQILESVSKNFTFIYYAVLFSAVTQIIMASFKWMNK